VIEDFCATTGTLRDGVHQHVVGIILQGATLEVGLSPDLLNLRILEPHRQHLPHTAMIAGAIR
jgi:hypothetical protein